MEKNDAKSQLDERRGVTDVNGNRMVIIRLQRCPVLAGFVGRAVGGN